MPTKIDPGIKLLGCLIENRDFESERDLLDKARKVLKDADYKGLEQILRQGYGTSDDVPRHNLPWIYEKWCKAFRRPHITVHDSRRDEEGKEVYIVLTPTGIRMDEYPGSWKALLKLGWGPNSNCNFYMCLPELPLTMGGYLGCVETAIEKGLATLKLPFHRGLPPPYSPARNRWERLMGEDVLLTHRQASPTKAGHPY